MLMFSNVDHMQDVQHAEAEMLLEREYLRSNKVIE